MKLPFSPLVFYIACILGIGAMVGLFYSFDEKQDELASIVQTLVVAQQQELEKTQKEIELLRLTNELESQEKEQEIEVQKNALAELSSRLTVLQNTPPEVVTPNTTDAVADWKDSVFRISCSFVDVARKKRLTQGGSGVGMNLSDGAIFMTNRHVLTRDDGSVLEKCTLTSASGAEFDLPLNEFRADPKLDFAFTIFSTRQSYFNKTLTETNVCSVDNVEQGETIAILGYPITGAQGGITVTEGIISGFESDYYVTSAKIEQGNSGGAAVLTSESCLLGLPTFAQVGKVESLARILKLEKLVDL